MITTYLNVFRDKLKRLRKQIKAELIKPKKERNKSFLKKMIREVKELEVIVNDDTEEYNLYLSLKKKYDQSSNRIPRYCITFSLRDS